MADLRIDDAVTSDAVTVLNSAVSALAPVLRAARTLDTQVVGASPLAEDLARADRDLAAALETIGNALTGLAGEIGDAAAALAQADITLATAVPGPVAGGAAR